MSARKGVSPDGSIESVAAGGSTSVVVERVGDARGLAARRVRSIEAAGVSA